jgi:hypothetical protein
MPESLRFMMFTRIPSRCVDEALASSNNQTSKGHEVGLQNVWPDRCSAIPVPQSRIAPLFFCFPIFELELDFERWFNSISDSRVCVPFGAVDSELGPVTAAALKADLS